MGNSKKYVVLDLDGVLADFPSSYSRLAANYFLVPHVNTYTQTTTRLLEGHASDADLEFLWSKVEASPDFWATIPSLLTEYDVRGMHMLHQEGVELVYLTNRHYKGTMLAQTYDWLIHNNLPQGRVVPTKNKDLYLREHLLESARPHERLDGYVHTDTGTLLGVIEDAPKNLLAYDKGIVTWYWRPVVFVADRLYNKDVAPRLPRVASVLDFCNRMLDYIDHPPTWTEALQDA